MFELTDRPGSDRTVDAAKETIERRAARETASRAEQ